MKLLRFILPLAFLILAVPAFGQTNSEAIQFTPEVPIPGVFEGNQTVDENFTAKYIRGLYIYFIWIVGVLATFMVIYGGVKWVTASGNPSRINDAREVINNAIIGVIIALLSVVILNLISPQFTTLGLPSLPGVKQNTAYFSTAAVTGVCPFDISLDGQNLTCGQIQKVGSFVSPATGKLINRYCIATFCPYGFTSGSIQAATTRRVCALGTKVDPSTNATYLTPGRGCIDRIQLLPSTGQFANIASIPVTQTAFGASFACGDIEKVLLGDESYRVGQRCSAGDRLICYMIGDKGVVQDNAIIDKLSNMRCAPTTP